VHALFPHLDSREVAKTAARISALEERNRVVMRLLAAGGIESVRSFTVVEESVAALKGPGILAIFHVGGLYATRAVLGRLHSPVVAFRAGPLFAPEDSLRVESTAGDERQRAAALHRALLHLRHGGLLVLALDAVADRGVETRCLGRTLSLAPGAFALARWSGAPIIPLVARWTSGGVQVAIGDSIETPQDAATWLERYLLASPSEITLGLLRTLLDAS
jgi:lauroyl/myristoyl acyltransferase